MENTYIVDVNEQNAQQVLETSMDTPLLFLFWAPSVPESLEMRQSVEQLAHEYRGTFTLAVVDCEQQQMLAMQLGVRALPTLALFNQGRPVDGLAGPQSDEAVREMLTRHLPSQEELDFKQAQSLMEEGQFGSALGILKPLQEVLGEAGAFKLALAECLVETQLFDEAQEILDTVLMQDQDAKYKALIAKVELHNQAAESPEVVQLQEAYNEDPENHEIGFKLAVQLSQVNRHEEALEILMAMLRKDLNTADGEARKTMMDILSSLGQGNPVASKFRRQLYTLLY